MKKLFLLFLLMPFLAGSQTITDTATLRTRINTQIVPNGTQAITGQMLNNILNGYLNSWPDNRINTSAPLAWNPVTRTLVFTGTFTGVPTSRTLTIGGITFDLSANRTWNLTTTNIPEGTNLYWTQVRFNAAFAAKTTTDLAEGSNLYFTNARARAAISSGGTPIVYNPSTGVISLTTVPVSKGGTGLTSAGTAGQLIKSTGTGFILFTPQYLTAADTAGLGYNNLVFESGVERTGNIVRALHDAGIWNANEFVGFAIQTGQPLNNDIWQFKTAYNGWRRVQPSDIVSDGGGLTVEADPIYTANGVPKTLTLTINGVGYNLSTNRVWTLTTDNVSEGVTNLYFTNTRARTAISLTTTGSSGVATYNNATGVLNIPNYVQTVTLTGDVTGSGTTSIATTLATVNSNVGTFGSGTQVAQVTVNAKGLVTAVTNVPITGFLSSTLTNNYIYVGNASNVATGVPVSGDMTIANTGAITLNTVNSNVGTYNNVTVNGKGLITAASNVAYLTANQSITWTGSGDVSGSASGATSLTPTLTLATVNSNVGTFGSANQVPQITVNGKGLVTAVSNVTITGFASSTLASANIYVGSVSNIATPQAPSGDLTMNNTGVFTLNTVNSNVGTFNNVTVNGKGLITAASNVAYLTANQNITVTATGDATGTSSSSPTAPSLPLTLATVNSNVGTFGNSTTIPVITVNGKGLITAVSTAATGAVTTRDRFGYPGEDGTGNESRGFFFANNSTYNLAIGNSRASIYTLQLSNSAGPAMQITAAQNGVYAAHISNSLGAGIYVQAGGVNTAITAFSASGHGLVTSSTSQMGLQAISQTHYAAMLQQNEGATGGVNDVITVNSFANGTPTAGFGGRINFTLETDISSTTAGGVGFAWTDVTNATRTSSFEVYTVNSGTTGKKLEVAGNGTMTAAGYGSGSITGTATYNLAVTSTGKIIEVAAGGGGGGVTTVGTIDGQTKHANGLVISGSSIYAQTADATYPGLVSTVSQTFAGNKIFNGAVQSASINVWNSIGGFVNTLQYAGTANRGTTLPNYSGTLRVAATEQTLTDGTTVSWDMSLGTTAKVTLGGNRTLSVSNAVAGEEYFLTVIQDGTGSRTLALPAGWKVVNNGGGAVVLTTTAGAHDIISIKYTGSNYYVSYGRNFN